MMSDLELMKMWGKLPSHCSEEAKITRESQNQVNTYDLV